MIINAFFVICACVFGYHYERNGNPANFGEFVSRTLWSLIFALSYTSLAAAGVNVYLAAALFVLQFAATAIVPHAWVQNMGNWGTVQRKWPGFFLPANWPATWVPGSFDATLHDFLGMLSVGFIRGAVVFGLPLLASIWYHSPITWAAWVAAWWCTALGQPLAYLLGRHVNSSLWGNAPNSAEWGEFLVGVSWALSLIIAVFLP